MSNLFSLLISLFSFVVSRVALMLIYPSYDCDNIVLLLTDRFDKQSHMEHIVETGITAIGARRNFYIGGGGSKPKMAPIKR